VIVLRDLAVLLLAAELFKAVAVWRTCTAAASTTVAAAALLLSAYATVAAVAAATCAMVASTAPVCWACKFM
jgi:hypothetical protein